VRANAAILSVGARSRKKKENQSGIFQVFSRGRTGTTKVRSRRENISNEMSGKNKNETVGVSFSGKAKIEGPKVGEIFPSREKGSRVMPVHARSAVHTSS